MISFEWPYLYDETDFKDWLEELRYSEELKKEVDRRKHDSRHRYKGPQISIMQPALASVVTSHFELCVSLLARIERSKSVNPGHLYFIGYPMQEGDIYRIISARSATKRKRKDLSYAARSCCRV